jgi:hypothetical protein
VATKKQQRRREKERRHEYEVVYVDEEGNQVEPPPEAAASPAKTARASTAKAGQQSAKAQGRSKRPLREIKPPSWRRVFTRASILGVLMYLVLGLGKNHLEPARRLLLTLGYTALFVPTFYWIDRMAYRRYQRMSGRTPPPPKKAS